MVTTFIGLGSFADVGADSPWTVTVAWGDGSTDETLEVGTPGDLGSLPHTYADNGVYPVMVTVTDKDAASGTATFSVDVANVTPTVTAPANQTATEGTSKTFSLGSFTDPGAEGTWTVTVDWGDGTTESFPVTKTTTSATIPGKNHVYADDSGARTYPVTVSVLEADDTDGFPATGAKKTFSVTVSNVAPVVKTPGSQTVTVNSSTLINLVSFVDPGDDSPWTVTVTWGDGTTQTFTVTRPAGAAVGVAIVIPARAHTYATAGGKPVRVTVKDDGTTVGTASFTVTVR